jgi:hypothetical protein
VEPSATELMQRRPLLPVMPAPAGIQ